MTIIGNDTRSTAQASNPLASQSISVTAPFDGYLNDTSAFVQFGVNNGGSFSINGIAVAIPGGQTSYVPFVATVGPNGLSYLSGQTIVLSYVGGGLSSAQIFAPAASPQLNGLWQLWADFLPVPIPGPPSTAPTASPTSMSSWNITGFTASSSPSAPQVVSSALIQRSTDGGATWTTIDTVALPGGTYTYLDAGVPAGPLAYRTINANTTGQSAPSPVLTILAPGAPVAPVLTPISMTSWSLSWAGAANAYQYAVQRSTDGGATWVTQVTQTGTSWTDPSVPAGPLAYRIQAQNSVGSTTGATATAGPPASWGFTAPTLSEILT